MLVRDRSKAIDHSVDWAPRGIQFYTLGHGVTSRWPDPDTSKVDLGFPRTL